ncbi:MAG: DNA internalization-related competence protein ComEC/Rec2 [Acidobacteria bacterium]|nr:DNA internalization-related competence protein ComEC/Rec2 [Acidobacteriota bacterium]MBI3656438.1 DNA internalization-related competence protein ComEC/Rec2 [Acidobacteriota bacterium]
MSLARPSLWKSDVGFQRSPFLYIGALFAGGIALAETANRVPIWIWFVSVSLVVSAALVASFLRKHFLALILALTAVGLFGLVWMLFRAELQPAHHIRRYFQRGFIESDGPVEVRGRLESDLERHSDKVVFYLGIEQIGHRRQTLPACGTARVSVYSSQNVPEDFFPQGLHYGDRVRALVRLRQPRNFQDPGAFDFAGYLRDNDIDAIASAKSPRLIEKLAGASSMGMMPVVQKARRWMIQRFESTLGPDGQGGAYGQAAAIVIALVIGERTSLAPQIEEDFKRTGTYHVLVISGLHVVALAYVLAALLRWARLSAGIQVAIILLVLLFYTLLAGARPSIVRATVMVSACLIGNLIYRERHFLNTTCMSAVSLLVLNPAWLWDIGFQLTFAAVLTIGLVGIPLVEFLILPYSRGLASVFSDTVSVTRSGPDRRMRRTRFWAELWVERWEGRFFGASRRVWLWVLRGLAWLVGSVGSLVVMSVAIQSVMLVLMVNYFHRVSLISPLINLAVVPLTTVLLFVAVLMLPLTAISVQVTAAASWAVKALVSLTLYCVTTGSQWRFAEYRVPTPPQWVTLGFLISLMAAAALTRGRWRRGAIGTFIAFLLCLVVHPFAPPAAPGVLELTALDVGQGDALFVQFPGGKTMLVDGGGFTKPGDTARDVDDPEKELGGGFDIGEQVVAPYLWQRGLRSLDFVALTHAHHDHIGGLPFILDHFSVGALLDGRNPHAEPEYSRLLQKAGRRGVPVHYLRRGDRLVVDGVAVAVLNPDERERPDHVSNNDSLTLRLQYGEVSLLLTGDIEKRVESELSDLDCVALRADVLKAPHHGSRTSSTDPFVACVDPTLVIVSAGADNPFGHPSGEVMSRFTARHSAVYETAKHGAVTVKTDGKRLYHSRSEANRP